MKSPHFDPKEMRMEHKGSEITFYPDQNQFDIVQFFPDLLKRFEELDCLFKTAGRHGKIYTW